MQVKVGNFTKVNTNNIRLGEAPLTTLHARSGDGGTNTISIGFVPKAIIFFTAYNTQFGVTEGFARTTFANGVNVSIGMYDGTTAGTAAISCKDWNGVNTTNTAQTITNAALVCISDFTSADHVVIMSLATCSFSGTDVIVQWHWNDGAEIKIGYIAFGGDDIDVKLLEWQVPGTQMANTEYEEGEDGALGEPYLPDLFGQTSKLVTGVGFKSDMIFSMGTMLGNPNEARIYDDDHIPAPEMDGTAALFFSAAPRGQMSICQAVYDENARFLATQTRSILGLGLFDVLPQTFFYGTSATPTGETVSLQQAAVLGGADPALVWCRGTLSEINDDGFRVVYDQNAAQGEMPRYSLCIKGGRWKTMSITPPLRLLPSSNRFQLHEDLPFEPIGAMTLHGHFGKAIGVAFGSIQRYGTVGPNCLGVGVTDGVDVYSQCHISAGPGPTAITARVASSDNRLAILPGFSTPNPIPALVELAMPLFGSDAMLLEWSDVTGEGQIVQMLLIGETSLDDEA